MAAISTCELWYHSAIMPKAAAAVLYNNSEKVTISVYCHRHLATPWKSDFTANQRMDDVIGRIWTEELSKILVEGSVDRQEINLYHIVSASETW